MNRNTNRSGWAITLGIALAVLFSLGAGSQVLENNERAFDAARHDVRWRQVLNAGGAGTNAPAPAPAPNTLPLPMMFSLDIFTNLPVQTDMTLAKFQVASGALLENGQVENFIDVSYFYRTNWMVTVGVENAPSSSVIDSARLMAGYGGAWQNARFFAQAGVQRNWATNAINFKASTQAVIEFGATWHVVGQQLNAFTAVDWETAKVRPLANGGDVLFKLGLSAQF